MWAGNLLLALYAVFFMAAVGAGVAGWWEWCVGFVIAATSCLTVVWREILYRRYWPDDRQE